MGECPETGYNPCYIMDERDRLLARAEAAEERADLEERERVEWSRRTLVFKKRAEAAGARVTALERRIHEVLRIAQSSPRTVSDDAIHELLSGLFPYATEDAAVKGEK